MRRHPLFRAARWIRTKNLVLQSYVGAMACIGLAPGLPGGSHVVVPVSCVVGIACALATVKLQRIPTLVALAVAIVAHLLWTDGGVIGGSSRAVVAGFFGTALVAVELLHWSGTWRERAAKAGDVPADVHSGVVNDDRVHCPSAPVSAWHSPRRSPHRVGGRSIRPMTIAGPFAATKGPLTVDRPNP
jgi:hypothetical protein